MSVGNEREFCPPPVTLTPRMKLIRDVSGTVSLVTTMMSAISISILGEHLVIWIVYLISAVTGIINNLLFHNKKMMIVFIVFMITNSICITRLIVGW